MKKTLLLLSAAILIFSSSCAKKPSTVEAATVNTENTVESTETPVKSVVKTIPETVKGKNIMTTIAANYKGKVVLFDFWATWCGPCRMAMKKIDEIKPELEKKGCVFVYVTGETSPLEDWQPMIKGISGDHYRLTAAQWTELCQDLNIPGIPSYMLYGKDGKKAYDNLSQGGYPGSEILKNNIEVALTK